jgi:hypothetical protein
MKAW